MLFTVKYFDLLVTIAALKVLDFQFPKVLGSVRLSLLLCKILLRFVRFIFFCGHLGFVLHNPQQQGLVSRVGRNLYLVKIRSKSLGDALEDICKDK